MRQEIPRELWPACDFRLPQNCSPPLLEDVLYSPLSNSLVCCLTYSSLAVAVTDPLQLKVNAASLPVSSDRHRETLAQHPSSVLSAMMTSAAILLSSSFSLGWSETPATAGSKSGPLETLLPVPVPGSELVSCAALLRRRALSSALLTPGILPGP